MFKHVRYVLLNSAVSPPHHFVDSLDLSFTAAIGAEFAISEGVSRVVSHVIWQDSSSINNRLTIHQLLLINIKHQFTAIKCELTTIIHRSTTYEPHLTDRLICFAHGRRPLVLPRAMVFPCWCAGPILRDGRHWMSVTIMLSSC